MKCPVITQEQRAALRRLKEESLQRNPVMPMSRDRIVRALMQPESSHLITTSLYWDCDCPDNFQKPRDMEMCEECGTFREDAPDSRINELGRAGIHLDWTNPQVMATCEEHQAG